MGGSSKSSQSSDQSTKVTNENKQVAAYDGSFAVGAGASLTDQSRTYIQSVDKEIVNEVIAKNFLTTSAGYSAITDTTDKAMVITAQQGKDALALLGSGISQTLASQKDLAATAYDQAVGLASQATSAGERTLSERATLMATQEKQKTLLIGIALIGGIAIAYLYLKK